ncbi:MAG: hypothetical protein IKP22_09555 [Clostridia bacterium]|nr:hypothetical protein [Clostridia bacterium]
MKKIISILLSAELALGCCAALGEAPAAAPAAEETQQTHRIETKQVPLYLGNVGRLPREVPLYFLDGVADMPYLNLPDLMDVEAQIAEALKTNTVLTGMWDEESQLYAILNTVNDSAVLFSFDMGTVIYTNFDTFAAESGQNRLDILYHPGVNSKNQPELFKRTGDPLMNRPGNSQAIFLDEYQIPYAAQDGKYLLPLHTALELTLCMPSASIIQAYNGEAIFLGGPGMFVQEKRNDAGENVLEKTELGELYYGASGGQRSPEFAEYGLGELCMELDHFYGLKDAHSISSFMELVARTDYYEQLASPDAAVADQALVNLIHYYLDDLHSSYKYNSWLTGFDRELESRGYGFSSIMDSRYTTLYNSARARYYPDGWYYYQEVGNTAYVTFDDFQYDSDFDYYSLDLDDPKCVTDTVSLILYAHRKITREGSPIQRVVLDLSNNIGGQADAAVFVMGWFLGEATVTNVNTFTGAQGTSQYAVDANLDRVFDDKDYLAGDYALYCLTSPVSFSCANLVPWVFKTSGLVTLLGTQSGGGSCVVQYMTTAWGTVFRISGYRRLAFVKNGSFYDVDRGVEPDVTLTKLSSFYDRQRLNQIMDEMY